VNAAGSTSQLIIMIMGFWDGEFPVKAFQEDMD
jgi:hypothetical protein